MIQKTTASKNLLPKNYEKEISLGNRTYFKSCGGTNKRQVTCTEVFDSRKDEWLSNDNKGHNTTSKTPSNGGRRNGRAV